MVNTKSEPIRVLIADSDPLVCRALARLLRDVAGIEVVATALDGPTTLERAAQFRANVALIDAGTARLDGMELTRSLRRQLPALQVIVLSVYATFRAQAFAAGACRFLLKDCSRAELVAAVQLAAQEQCLTLPAGAAP